MKSDNWKIADKNKPFTSEALLHQAIGGLLQRMPDVSDVQILQGAQEYGKDLVFRTKGTMGEVVQCACVVKNAPITGKVGSASGARTVLQQIEQAQDTPFLDHGAREIYIHRVYVIDPFPISQTALSSIKGKLSQRAGQVTFVTGNEFFELLTKYWPDFFADEATAIERHLAALEQAGEDQTLSNLAFEYDLGDVAGSGSPIYVETGFHRTLHEFSLAKDILADDIFTSYALVARIWRKADVSAWIQRLTSLKGPLEHLSSWERISGSKSRELLELIDRAGDSLKVAFVESANIALKAAFVESANKASRKTRTYTYSAIPNSLEVKLAPQKATRLASKLLAQLSQRYTTCVLELIKSISAFIREESRKVASENVLDQVTNCAELLAADDCLLAMRPSPLRVSSLATMTFHSDLPAKDGSSLLIAGGPGSGKTTFCRRRALRDAKFYAERTSKVLPIFVPLHKLSRTRIESFPKTFLGSFAPSSLLDCADQYKGHIRLYLDGLDEITDLEQRHRIVQLVRDEAERDTSLQVVMTARDYLYSADLMWMPRINISALNEEQFVALATKWLGGGHDAGRELWDEVQKVPSMKTLMKVPLLATVLILTYRRTHRIPESKARLYNSFVQLLAGGWDLVKGILRSSRFGISIKQLAITNLASHLHWSRKKIFSGEDFARAVGAVLNRMKLKDIEELLDELLIDGLLTRSGIDYHFSHLSFQEFCAAKSLVGDPSSRGVNKVLDLYAGGDDWWAEVIDFYMGLSENPIDMKRWIRRAKDRKTELKSRLRSIFPEYH